MDPAAASTCLESRLRLSKAPTAELAAAALRAQKVAGLDGGADFIVVAVPPGTAEGAVGPVEAAARAAPAEPPE